MPGFVAEDVERALDGHRLLVGSVPGDEGAEDVGDGHHARWDRDLTAGKPARIARAVQLLMMSIGDLRHIPVLARPGNFGQETEGMRDVALDLAPLLLGEAPPADRERAQLVR